MAGPEGFIVMDATKSIEAQQAEMRKIVEKSLAGYVSPINCAREIRSKIMVSLNQGEG
jgi:hypothetical protein